MGVKGTRHFDPVFEYWSQYPALAIWEIATLMKGYEPRLLGDVVVNADGDGLDTSVEVRILCDAVQVGQLVGYQVQGGLDPRETKIEVSSLLHWLRARGYAEMAVQLAAHQLPLERGPILKKRVLLSKHQARWPGMSNDFQHANENGLSATAKAEGHGNWYENDALDWARTHGKLLDLASKSATPASPFPT